ncbi:MAG: hypothetical protein LBC06_03590 [Rickettsiales bacterium]|jgi:predicted enzyme involved in methoxymalonyl-ACP biosynthesis|nr:hypothetical protein [Rickettsiales bacterium]
MKALEYPFEGGVLISKRKSILRKLRKSVSQSFLSKKIAILGGSTTASIRNMLEVFLLSQGIDPEFYESEYAQYWQDAMSW